MRIKLEIIVDVDLDGTDSEQILENMHNIPVHAMSNGLVTGDTAATVDTWNYTVSVIN